MLVGKVVEYYNGNGFITYLKMKPILMENNLLEFHDGIVSVNLYYGFGKTSRKIPFGKAESPNNEFSFFPKEILLENHGELGKYAVSCMKYLNCSIYGEDSAIIYWVDGSFNFHCDYIDSVPKDGIETFNRWYHGVFQERLDYFMENYYDVLENKVSLINM